MKNVKLEEEMIYLKEKNKLKLKNIEQNMNKGIKEEIFISSCNRENNIALNKVNSVEIKINRNKNGYFEDKKLLGNDLNYKVKRVNIKRIIVKYYLIINIFILIIPYFFSILLSYSNKFFFESKFSNITLKIKGTGDKYILSISDSGTYSFNKSNYPNMIYINRQQNFTITNKYYFDKDDNYVDLIWNNTIDNCYYMFYKCSDITEIDLFNFDTSKVTDMRSMFNSCSQLSSLNLSNFDTSKVTNMGYMFSGCSQLSSLNISNFDTSKVTNMGSMFDDCSQLSSLNLSNFNTSKVINMGSMFYGCSQLSSLNLSPDNIVICLNENSIKILNEIKNKTCYNIDCSDFYNQKKIVNIQNICWDNNDNNILYKYEFNGIYYEDCNGGNLTKNTQIKNCRCNNTICSSCPNLPLNDTFCNECNTGYYQIENDIYNYNNQYFKCYKNPIGYYLDINESIYKKCFYSCKACEIKGDNIEHNCLECNDNYSYEIKINNYSNCYEKCNYYHYFDNNNEIHCTFNFSCPQDYPHLIQPKNECIVLEIESSIIFNINISQSTTIIETDDDKQYSENKYFSSEIINEIESSEIFNNNISISSTIVETFSEIMRIIENLMGILKNETIKKTRKEEIEYYDTFIHNIETIFTSKYFNTTKIDEGKDEIYETQKIKVTFTTSKNQKNNLNDNTTSIDLGKCEEELKKFYNLKDNEIIYIRKMDIIQEGMRIPKIEYDIYCKLYGDNLVKLNLSICNKTEIYLYIPIKDIGNLDQLNKSSGY